MERTMEDRAQKLAVYMIETGGTVRSAARQFGISKSTVHKDLQQRLPGGKHRRLRRNAPLPGLYRRAHPF